MKSSSRAWMTTSVAFTLSVFLWLFERAENAEYEATSPELPPLYLSFDVSSAHAATAARSHGLPDALSVVTAGQQSVSMPSSETEPELRALRDAELTPNERRQVLRAEEVYVEACMRESGLPYIRQQYRDRDIEARDFEALDPADEDGARAVGYQIALELQRGSHEPGFDANQPYLDSLSPQERQHYDRTLSGSAEVMQLPEEQLETDPAFAYIRGADGSAVAWDRRSCIAQAQAKVSADLERVEALTLEVEALQNQVAATVEADATFKAALDQWRGCMAEAGMVFESTEAAQRQLRTAYTSERWSLNMLAVRESAVAVRDARCQMSSRLSDIRREISQRESRLLAQQHQGLVHELWALNRASLAEADTVLEHDALRLESPL